MNHAAEGPRPARPSSRQASGIARAGAGATNRVRLRIAVLVLLLAALWTALLLAAASVAPTAPLQPAQRLRHQGSDFGVLAGAGAGIDDDRLLNIAAIGAEQVAMQALTLDAPIVARDFPVLRYRWQHFPRTLELSFLFRRADAPGDVHTITLPPAGRHPGYFDLGDVPDWRGDITEIGFAEYPTAQLVPEGAAFKPFALVEAELWSPSWRGSLGALGTDWLAYRPWSLMSVSALGPDAPWPHKAPPVPVLAAGLLAGVLLGAALMGRRRRPIGVALCIALGVGWIALDLLWLLDFNDRNALTRELHAGRSWRERAAIVPDLHLVAAAQRVQGLLAHAPANTRVVVAADTAYTMLRLDYHLLPANAAPASALGAQPALAWGAPVWLLAYATSDWRFDAAGGTLRGPAVAYAARVVVEEGDLRVYRLDGVAR